MAIKQFHEAGFFEIQRKACEELLSLIKPVDPKAKIISIGDDSAVYLKTFPREHLKSLGFKKDEKRFGDEFLKTSKVKVSFTGFSHQMTKSGTHRLVPF